MRRKLLTTAFAVVVAVTVSGAAFATGPLAKLWTGEAWFEVQPDRVAPTVPHMHCLAMFWDDVPGDPHYKAYYITGAGGDFWTGLARSYDGVNFENVSVVLTTGPEGSWDDWIASFSSVWKEGDVYYMVYEGANLDPQHRVHQIGLATSTDGIHFTKRGPIFAPSGVPGTFDSHHAGTPSLYKEAGTWYLFYHGHDAVDVQIGLATAPVVNGDWTDLRNFQRVQSTPIIPTSASGWDSGTTGKRSRLIREGDYWYMAFEGSTDQPFDTADWSTGIARSTDLVNWEKLPTNPVLPQTSGGFGYDGPELMYVGDDIYIYFRLCDGSGGNDTYRAKLIAIPEPSTAAPVALKRRNIVDIQTLTTFFMWCTIINGALLVLWTIMFILAPNLVYRTQSKWFPVPRETFNLVMYLFLGLFKIIYLVFNLVPYVALLIIG